MSCGCLGSLSREPIGWATVARNGVLLVMAAVAMGATSLQMPPVESVVASTTFVLLSAVAIQLAVLRQTIGPSLVGGVGR